MDFHKNMTLTRIIFAPMTKLTSIHALIVVVVVAAHN